MIRTMLKSKIHRARITGVNVDYQGSITIDPVLMRAAGILTYEQVAIVDIHNGARFETYVIPGEEASGEICLNGAAARLVAKDDLIIIISYCQVDDQEAAAIKPIIVQVDVNNKPLTEHPAPDWANDLMARV